MWRLKRFFCALGELPKCAVKPEKILKKHGGRVLNPLKSKILLSVLVQRIHLLQWSSLNSRRHLVHSRRGGSAAQELCWAQWHSLGTLLNTVAQPGSPAGSCITAWEPCWDQWCSLGALLGLAVVATQPRSCMGYVPGIQAAVGGNPPVSTASPQRD